MENIPEIGEEIKSCLKMHFAVFKTMSLCFTQVHEDIAQEGCSRWYLNKWKMYYKEEGYDKLLIHEEGS